MRWSRGVAEVEIGDKLLHDCFGLDVSGGGSDGVRDCIAWHRKGDSIVRPGIPLSYGLSTRTVQEGHCSTEKCPDSLPDRGVGALDMDSGSIRGLEADFPEAAVVSGQSRFHGT